VPTCRESERKTMMVLYQLYHSVTGTFGPESDRFMKENGESLGECRIETLAVWPVLHDDDPPWEIRDCVSVFEEYGGAPTVVGS
jgi:hypothetical protein